jgi:hypothetical protein
LTQIHHQNRFWKIENNCSVHSSILAQPRFGPQLSSMCSTLAQARSQPSSTWPVRVRDALPRLGLISAQAIWTIHLNPTVVLSFRLNKKVSRSLPKP